MVLSRASLFNALRKVLDLILVGPKHEEFRRVSDPILSKSRMDLFQLPHVEHKGNGIDLQSQVQ